MNTPAPELLSALFAPGPHESLGRHAETYGRFVGSWTGEYEDRLPGGRAERGIIVCGSGAGVSIAANKFPGIRAAVCHDTYTAHQAVEHDDMNVLCLGSEVVGAELAADLVRAFLGARFDGGERYIERLKKVERMERAMHG